MFWVSMKYEGVNYRPLCHTRSRGSGVTICRKEWCRSVNLDLFQKVPCLWTDKWIYSLDVFVPSVPWSLCSVVGSLFINKISSSRPMFSCIYLLHYFSPFVILLFYSISFFSIFCLFLSWFVFKTSTSYVTDFISCIIFQSYRLS